MWRTGYPPSLTLPRPIRSRFLSLPPPRSSSFFPLFSPCVASSPASSPLPLLSSTACSPARLYAHLHAPRVTYTDKMAYTVPVVQIAGNCSPRRGLSSSAFVEGRKGEGPGPTRERVKLRILWFTNVILYKGIWIYGKERGEPQVKIRPCDLRGPTAR